MQSKSVSVAAAALLLAGAAACSVAAAQAAPNSRVAASQATDLGAAPDADVKEIAITLKLPDRAGLEKFVASTVDPASRNFRRFLTPAQFAARFGQPDAVVARVRNYLESQGMTVTQVFGNKLVLTAKASNAQLASAFSTAIHTFGEAGSVYQRPATRAVMPAALADVVAGVSGLSTRAVYHPHTKKLSPDLVPDATGTSRSASRSAATPTPGAPGSYTVKDLASRYNITPLYNAGINGAGTTLGIMTFATFNAADVGFYWNYVGLGSSTARITTVNVGSGQTANGADETTLDVEQSGGVAPGAKIRVYVAPNTDAGAIALYTQAVTENLCDTLSISWGESELYYDPAVDLPPYDQIFLQAASQGIPISASSGDEGAYDLNYSGAFPYPSYTALLSLDYPSSSPYILAAGGTTLPVTLSFNSGRYVISVPSERPWAWDYLADGYLIPRYGQAYYYNNYFPVGGGGGVSVVYPMPAYQQGLAGIQASAPGQSMFCQSSPANASATNGPFPCTPGDDIIDLPAGYGGRNSPDISLNADPETGYALYYNSAWSLGYGGTSFVAPQLNGIFALLTQKLGHRVGWPHPQLYTLFKTMGYASGSPFRAIANGDNLYYGASPSYNPATGLGALDVNNLATALSR